MRCFVAIELPKDVKDYLFSLQKSLSGEDVKVNWVAKKNLHLTLKFLGEVDEEKIKKVKGLLTGIGFESFRVKLGSIGFFPNEDYLRVVWIGLEPKEKIIELQKRIDESLVGLVGDEQEFSAHLTLGRIKFVKDKAGFLKRAGSVLVKGMEFEISGFKLIKSELTKDGPWYEVIEEHWANS